MSWIPAIPALYSPRGLEIRHSWGLEQQANPAILGNPLVIERFANWKTTMKLIGKSYLYMFIIYRPWLP